MANTIEIMLDHPVKEVISAYPKIGNILGEFKIGCVDCGVGTCLLKDVLDIHHLEPEAERDMMERIARVIEPGRTAPVPLPERKAFANGRASASPPIRKLVAEHRWILRWAALIPLVAERADLATDEGRQLILDGVEFIRSYADRYHHAKEEDILFRYFSPDLDIIQAMLTDHDTARGHVRAIVAAVEQRDTAAAREHLLAYAALLDEHIHKEDDILYPWMDRLLLDSQVGKMHGQFAEVDRQFGGLPHQLEQFVAELEIRWGVPPPAEDPLAALNPC